MTTVTPELIRRQAAELQQMDHEDARVEELAREVDRLNRQVRDNADLLEFDDEPLAYQARLRALSEQTR